MSHIVPVNEQDTAAWKIFNMMFGCTTKAINSYSTDHLQLRGMPGNADGTVNMKFANQHIYREMTINQMFELHRSGAVIHVVSPVDTKAIYEIIAEHLENWKEYLRTHLNTGHAPLDELVELDAFASVVYKHAIQHFTRATADTFLDGSLAAQMKASVFQAFNQDAPGITPEMKQELPQERKSIADAFKTYAKGSNGERKWS